MVQRNPIQLLYLAMLAYRRALRTCFYHYFGIFAVDICWALLFFPIIQRGLLSLTDKNIEVGPGISIVMLLTSVIWFFVHAVFFLAMRDTHKVFDSEYYRHGLIRYTQLFVAFSFVVLFGVVVLASFGVIRFPQLHWSILVFLRYLGLIITLYWLDGAHFVMGMLRSLEQGVNMCVYNVGYFLFIVGISIGAQYGLGFGINYMLGASVIDVQSLLIQDHQGWYIATEYLKTTTAAVPIILIKFATFFIDSFFVCCMYVLYVLKKNIVYTQSLFEHYDTTD